MLKTFPTQTGNLLREITTRASGVFLWVHIVVNKFLESIYAGDDLAQLPPVVRELPAELELLFGVMFNGIQRRYKSEGLRMMCLMRHWKCHNIKCDALALSLACTFETIDLSVHEVLLSPREGLPGFSGKQTQLYQRQKRQMEKQPSKEEQQEALQIQLRNRLYKMPDILRSHCAGLLQMEALPDPRNDHNRSLFVSSTVDYLHKSVDDFLSCAAVKPQLINLDFDVNEASVTAFACMIRAGFPGDIVKDMASLSRLAEHSSRKPQNRVLGLVQQWLDPKNKHALPQAMSFNCDELLNGNREQKWSSNFLALMAATDNELYVLDKLSGPSSMPRSTGRPFLHHSVCPAPPGAPVSTFAQGTNPRISRRLLELGQDPNETFARFTPWQYVLQHLKDYGFWVACRADIEGIADKEFHQELLETMRILLNSGASPLPIPEAEDEVKTSSREARVFSPASVLRLASDGPCPCQHSHYDERNKVSILECGCQVSRALFQEIIELLEHAGESFMGLTLPDKMAEFAETSTHAVIMIKSARSANKIHSHARRPKIWGCPNKYNATVVISSSVSKERGRFKKEHFTVDQR